MRTIAALTIAATLSSCSTLRDSTLLGLGVGATVGSAMGIAIGKNKKEKVQAAAIAGAAGAALGGVAGYLKFKEDQMKKDLPFAEPRGSPKDIPMITKPEVRRVWIPARIEGDQYIEGHFLYLIEKNSQFRSTNE